MKNIRLNAAPVMAKRPRCPECGDRLKPMFVTVKSERVPLHGGTGFTYQNYIRWDGDYHGYGAFDTMRCAVVYANERVNNPPRLRVGQISDAELNNISERITMSQIDELQSRLP